MIKCEEVQKICRKIEGYISGSIEWNNEEGDDTLLEEIEKGISDGDYSLEDYDILFTNTLKKLKELAKDSMEHRVYIRGLILNLIKKEEQKNIALDRLKEYMAIEEGDIK